jgi:hypothetical protein
MGMMIIAMYYRNQFGALETIPDPDYGHDDHCNVLQKPIWGIGDDS